MIAALPLASTARLCDSAAPFDPQRCSDITGFGAIGRYTELAQKFTRSDAVFNGPSSQSGD